VILTALLLAIQAQAPGDSITLADALARARTHRAVLTLARAQVAEARGAMRTAGAIPNPAVSYSHSGAVPTNHLLVDQPLDWMLRRGSDRAAAGAGITRARADSAQTVVALAHEVRLGFWRALAAQRSQSLVEAQAVQADSLARIAAARFRAGDISLLEQEQAALEAARAHQTASAAREGARVASAEFARALGLETAPRPAGRLDAGLDQPPDSMIDPATIPTVRAAVADSQAAAALARSAARARVPLPTVQSGAEWGDSAQPGTLAVVGVAIPLPLWQRGQGPVEEARARAAQAAALAREARLDALRDAREAHIRLEETVARARVARDLLIPSAGVLRARALRGYQAGESGIVPVLDAFRSERDVVLGAVQDELAYQEALADWYALTGRSE
jgi:cobalt-zinc-cadmium efflux system outer membrane protein